MNYNIEGILDIMQINEYKIINSIDICDSISIEDYIKEYENNKNCKNVNYNIINNIEILSVSINLKEVTKKKISNNNTNIYCINFIYNIDLALDINSKYEEININKIHSYSFIYKDIQICDLEIYTINLELKNLGNKMFFVINLIIVDKSKELNFKNHIESNKQIVENINNKDYSYININQEFI